MRISFGEPNRTTGDDGWEHHAVEVTVASEAAGVLVFAFRSGMALDPVPTEAHVMADMWSTYLMATDCGTATPEYGTTIAEMVDELGMTGAAAVKAARQAVDGAEFVLRMSEDEWALLEAAYEAESA